MKQNDNVLKVSGFHPDYMGFIFYKGSRRFVGKALETAIIQQIPSDIKKVGIFVNEYAEMIIELAVKYDLDLIQLHGSETVTECRAIRSCGFKVIKAFGVDHSFDFHALEEYLPVCDYFLLDTSSVRYGGTGRKFNWEKLKEYHYQTPFFLSGGIEPGDAEAICNLDHPSFHAVDINSRFEMEPGLKDVDQVSKFINTIRANNVNQVIGNSMIRPDIKK